MNIKNNTIIKVPQFEMDGNRQYGMSLNDVNNLMSKMMTKTFLEDLSQLFVDYQDFITNIRAYPFEVEKIYESANPNTQPIPVGSFIGTGLNGLILKNPKPTIQVNIFSISRYYNTFLDLSPYTKYELYLPYYGFTELVIDDLSMFDTPIQVYYTIDTYTGNALITITYLKENTEIILKTCECKIGFDIPIGATNVNAMVQNYTLGALTSIAGLYLGGTGLVGETIATGITTTGMTNALSSWKHKATTKGSINDNRNLLCLPHQVALLIHRPVAKEVNDYNFYFGRPLLQTKVLSTMQGYTEVGEIHLEDLGNATLTERQEIENLLKSGVIF